MRSSITLGYASVLLLETTQASWSHQINTLASRGQSGCPFDITSSGAFACPAGELSDGQIRLNGTEDTATFYIDSNGGITDSNGYGCIVTAAPTTQFQCDLGAAPAAGFSIDSSNDLLYNGSSVFYACPATDTEYNVYINPNFGQTKCFPISLKTSGCGAAQSSCPLPSTIWQTQTITSNSTVTVTVTATSSQLCSTPISTSSYSNSTTVCHHCTETKTW